MTNNASNGEKKEFTDNITIINTSRALLKATIGE